MKKCFKIFFFSLLLIILSGDASSSSMRIISLKPAITDIIVAMGHGEMLVGVTKYCDIPEDIKKPKIAGDYTKPYIERIIALKPDLVLNSKENSSKKSYESLKSTGIDVILFQFKDTKDMLNSINGIGMAIGKPEDALKLSRRMEKEMTFLKKRYSNLDKLRVLILWGRRPMVAAGPASYMDEYLKTIGARNAIENTKIAYPRIGIEELIAIDPDIIVDLSMGSESGVDNKSIMQISALKAVKNKRIYTMNAGDFRLSPNIIDGLNKLAKVVHE